MVGIELSVLKRAGLGMKGRVSPAGTPGSHFGRFGSNPADAATHGTLSRPLAGLVRIDPVPAFPISPYLHMQFMEPLGVTDGSVEAAGTTTPTIGAGTSSRSSGTWRRARSAGAGC